MFRSAGAWKTEKVKVVSYPPPTYASSHPPLGHYLPVAAYPSGAGRDGERQGAGRAVSRNLACCGTRGHCTQSRPAGKGMGGVFTLGVA